jgi:glucose-1-phosphate thymidylyltransferase
MYLGDNMPAGRHDRAGRRVPHNEPDALILLTPVPTPELRRRRADRRAASPASVEKPPEPQTDLALCGVYMFTAGIHDAAAGDQPSGRGELEITDAIQTSSTRQRVEPHIVRGWWKDTGAWTTCSRPTGSCSTRSTRASRAS